MIMNHYDILKITTNASTDEIRQSYKTLVKKYHPDLNNEDTANEDFILIYEAYSTLHDKERKREYDKFLTKIAV